jgi:hypothetical protein
MTIEYSKTWSGQDNSSPLWDDGHWGWIVDDDAGQVPWEGNMRPAGDKRFDLNRAMNCVDAYGEVCLSDTSFVKVTDE